MWPSIARIPPIHRISALFSAAALYLHVEGDAKRRTLDAALADPASRLPIRALLAQAPVVPTLYWCPGRSPGEA